MDISTFEDRNSRQTNQPALIDMVTLEILRFQTIPPELENTMDSNFSDLKVPGRNNPLYHYTGSADQIKFTVSWYSNHESREDVIRKCRWLEALTKADGYTRKPHSVKLIWGKLYKESTFIVLSAPYKMSLFNRDQGMLPTLATQELTLARVTESNLSFSNIQKFNY